MATPLTGFLTDNANNQLNNFNALSYLNRKENATPQYGATSQNIQKINATEEALNKNAQLLKGMQAFAQSGTVPLNSPNALSAESIANSIMTDPRYKEEYLRLTQPSPTQLNTNENPYDKYSMMGRHSLMQPETDWTMQNTNTAKPQLTQSQEVTPTPTIATTQNQPTAQVATTVKPSKKVTSGSRGKGKTSSVSGVTPYAVTPFIYDPLKAHNLMPQGSGSGVSNNSDNGDNNGFSWGKVGNYLSNLDNLLPLLMAGYFGYTLGK